MIYKGRTQRLLDARVIARAGRLDARDDVRCEPEANMDLRRLGTRPTAFAAEGVRRLDQLGHRLADRLHLAYLRKGQFPDLAVLINRRLRLPFLLELVHSASPLACSLCQADDPERIAANAEAGDVEPPARGPMPCSGPRHDRGARLIR